MHFFFFLTASFPQSFIYTNLQPSSLSSSSILPPQFLNFFLRPEKLKHQKYMLGEFTAWNFCLLSMDGNDQVDAASGYSFVVLLRVHVCWWLAQKQFYSKNRNWSSYVTNEERQNERQGR